MATLIERAVSQQRTQSPGLRPVPHQSRDTVPWWIVTLPVLMPLATAIAALCWARWG